MNKKPTQADIIKDTINGYLDKGFIDKSEIYTRVVDELGVPRPTVRRCAKEFNKELLMKVQILSYDSRGKSY